MCVCACKCVIQIPHPSIHRAHAPTIHSCIIYPLTPHIHIQIHASWDPCMPGTHDPIMAQNVYMSIQPRPTLRVSVCVCVPVCVFVPDHVFVCSVHRVREGMPMAESSTQLGQTDPHICTCVYVVCVHACHHVSDSALPKFMQF